MGNVTSIHLTTPQSLRRVLPAPRAPRSLWLQEALGHGDDGPALEGEHSADVCVVGGGYTGLWTALRVKELEPTIDVCLVEADVCGGGPSGRNGGFVMTWWVKFPMLARLCGTQEALRLARASTDAVVEIARFCREHAIDAHLRQDGWLWTASNRAQLGAWWAAMDALDRHGERPFVELEPDEVAHRSGSKRHLGGVLERSVATVQPAFLARGLRRVALERGVRIFERSPVTAVERPQLPVVRTDRGMLRAHRLVLATGPWLRQMRALRRSLVVIATDMVATEPIPEELDRLGLRDGVAISDSRALLHYYRTTLDGRIAFGTGGGTLALGGRIGQRFEGSSPRDRSVAASLRWLYPSLARVAVTASWTGPIDRSASGVPFFHRLDGRPDLVCGAGYSGNGVGPSWLGGRILASLALERDDEWAHAGVVMQPPGRFPREPVSYMGGLLVRAAVARKERAEDAGRDPDRLTTRVALLAPPGTAETRTNRLLREPKGR